jgi:hypothetical protein
MDLSHPHDFARLYNGRKRLKSCVCFFMLKRLVSSALPACEFHFNSLDLVPQRLKYTPNEGIGGPNLETDSIGQVVRWFSTFSESDYFLDRTSGMKKIPTDRRGSK